MTDVAIRPKTIDERVRDVIADMLSTTAGEMKPETRLEDLGADSLDSIEIVMALEDEFDIDMPDEEIDTLLTVQNAVDAVARLLAAK